MDRKTLTHIQNSARECGIYGEQENITSRTAQHTRFAFTVIASYGKSRDFFDALKSVRVLKLVALIIDWHYFFLPIFPGELIE